MSADQTFGECLIAAPGKRSAEVPPRPYKKGILVDTFFLSPHVENSLVLKYPHYVIFILFMKIESP